MKIVVTVKLVPDTTADKRIDPATKRLVRTGETVLNPFDEYAIEAALQLKEKLGAETTVTVVTMAPERGKEVVRKALAMGADDALMLSDPGCEGSDVMGTAYALAGAIAKNGFDLVVCGTQSTDAITGELPGALAEFLGVPGLTYGRKFEIDGTTLRAERETDSGFLKVTTGLPAVVSVTKSINEPRYPSFKGIMAAKTKPTTTLSLADLGIEASAVGLGAAATVVVDSAERPARGEHAVVKDEGDGGKRIADFLVSRKLL